MQALLANNGPPDRALKHHQFWPVFCPTLTNKRVNGGAFYSGEQRDEMVPKSGMESSAM